MDEENMLKLAETMPIGVPTNIGLGDISKFLKVLTSLGTYTYLINSKSKFILFKKSW